MRFSDFKQYRPNPGRNVFAFICDDEFLVEESRSVWAGLFAGNWTFEGMTAKEFEDLEPQRLMDEALTASLFAQSRGILVRNGDKLTKKRIEDLNQLQEVPNSNLKVVLVSDNPRAVEGWMRAFPLVEIDKLRPADVARWLMERYGVTADIARYIVEAVGTELYPLSNEMEKLQTYVGKDRAIEIRDVDVLILRSERFGPFDLDDAMLARQYKKDVLVAGAMLDEGVEPLVVLSRIARVWRQLFMGKGFARKHGPKEVAAIAMIPSWKAAEFVNGCHKYNWKQLALGFRELVNADRALKNSSPNVEAYFDVMLWKMVG